MSDLEWPDQSRRANPGDAANDWRREPPSLVEQRDAEIDELVSAVGAAFRAGRATVEVDARVLISALATLDSYRDMAGLPARPRRRRV